MLKHRKKQFIVPLAVVCCLALLVTTPCIGTLLWMASNHPAAPVQLEAELKQEENPAKEEPQEPLDITAPKGALDIRAVTLDENKCIGTEPTFLLSLTEPLDEKYLQTWLETSPEFDFYLKKTKNKLEYQLEPKAALALNTVYSFRFDPLQAGNDMPARAGNTWAFQTQKGFSLERVFPQNEGESVPVNSVIELTFSCEVDISQLQKHVSIHPALGGNDWTKTGTNEYTFMPTGGAMAHDTVYEVRVSGDLKDAFGSQTLGEDSVFRFITRGKETKSASFGVIVNHDYNAFPSTEQPLFSLYVQSDDDREITTVDSKVYRFKSLDDYAKVLVDEMNYDKWSGEEYPKLDTGALQKVLEAELKILPDGFIALPDALPKGFYAVQFQFEEDVTVTRQFQVTDLSAYAMRSGGDCLFWVNDLATKRPVSGAKITEIGSKGNEKTNALGVAQCKAPEKDGYAAYRIQKGADELLVMVHGSDENQSEFNPQAYWKYIYVDKELYQPNDTLNFFGAVSPKLPGVETVEQVTAVIAESWDYDADNSAIQVEVPVNNGVFDGQIKLPDLRPNHYYCTIYYGDTRLCNIYFEVKIYQKPTYSLSLAADKYVHWAGGTAMVTATAEYFDGTPVAQTELNLAGDARTTDASGQASIEYTVSSSSNGLIASDYVGASAEFPEIGEVDASTYFTVVTRDVELESSVEHGEGRVCNLELQTFAVDINDVKYESYDDYSPYSDAYSYQDKKEYLKDFEGKLPLTVKWTRISYHKKSTDRKEYDPYTKTYVEYYEYERREKLEGSKKLTINGKDPQVFSLPLSSDEASYEIEITGKDSEGRAFEHNTYLSPKRPGQEQRTRAKSVYIKSSSENNRFAVGDTISLTMMDEQSDMPVETGASLFMRGSDRLLDYDVSRGKAHDFTFGGDALPNLTVLGVYFDGREYLTASWSATLDRGSRMLNLDVAPDKESYTPGETAKLSLTLTDPQGNPVQGAVNLNMVDEALLSLREQYVDINAKVFSAAYYSDNTYTFNYSSSISHKIVQRFNPGGECGGGEGPGDRSDFRDTALFKTVQTDKKGKAAVEVKLPDNITSWRIFWQAFRAEDAMAGSGRCNVIATLPFFADIRLGDTFLVGDKPKLGIRNAGVALADGNVEYTVNIPSMKFRQTVTAPTSVWHEMELPALVKSTHDISVAARYKEYSDQISTKFTVLEGFADHMASKTFALSNTTKLDVPASGAVRLVLADRQRSQVMSALWALWTSGDIRAEQVIARKIVEDVMADRSLGYAHPSGSDYAEKIARYQKADGRIAPFVYSDGEESQTLETTVLACVVASECFNKAGAASYLTRQLDLAKSEKDLERQTLALAGLAALKEPVLPVLNTLEQSNLPEAARCNLALAHIFIGNGSQAKAIVTDVINKTCKKAGNTMYVAEDTREEIIAATANLAMAAVLLDIPEGDMLFQYILENRGVEDRYLLQQAFVLQNKAQSVTPECLSLRYTIDGQEKQVDLFTCYSLLLTAEQLRSLRFSEISPGIEATVHYTASGFPAGNEAQLKVKQSYPKEISATGTSTIELTFRIDAAAPDGAYNIVHVLPAGLAYSRYYTSPWDLPAWLSEEKGKQLTFTVHKRRTSASGTITIYTRPTMTGSFRSEGTYIINADKPKFVNQTEGSIVLIK